jgi:hypothetical protein
LLGLYLSYDGVQRAKLEHECVPGIVLAVGRDSNLISLAYPFALVPKTCIPELAKEKEALAGCCMGRNCEIAAHHQHVPNLPFTEILEHSVGTQLVRIPVLLALFSGDHDHQSGAARGDDAPLLLPTVTAVDVSAPIVSAAALEQPACHRPTPWSRRSYT